MKNLKKFQSVEAYNTFAVSEDFVEPNVSMISSSTVSIKYNKDKPTPSHDYSQDYFTLEALESGTLTVNKFSYENLFYSLNDGEWVEQTGAPISENLVEGDKVRFKLTSTSGVHNINFTGNHTYYGNIMSLVYGDDFEDKTTLPVQNLFNQSFKGNTGLTSAENLILPATTLTDACYNSMFENCTSLTTAPELPATTLASQCYIGMFSNCTSLTTAPELPATTLANSCYNMMFEGCTGLTTAPELPATTLTTGCYSSMFQGCSSLNYIKCLATNTPDMGYTANWVDGVASSGTFVKDPNTEWPKGDSFIPTNWTVEDAS